MCHRRRPPVPTHKPLEGKRLATWSFGWVERMDSRSASVDEGRWVQGAVLPLPSVAAIHVGQLDAQGLDLAEERAGMDAEFPGRCVSVATLVADGIRRPLTLVHPNGRMRHSGA